MVARLEVGQVLRQGGRSPRIDIKHGAGGQVNFYRGSLQTGRTCPQVEVGFTKYIHDEILGDQTIVALEVRGRIDQTEKLLGYRCEGSTRLIGEGKSNDLAVCFGNNSLEDTVGLYVAVNIETTVSIGDRILETGAAGPEVSRNATRVSRRTAHFGLTTANGQVRENGKPVAQVARGFDTIRPGSRRHLQGRRRVGLAAEQRKRRRWQPLKAGGSAVEPRTPSAGHHVTEI